MLIPTCDLLLLLTAIDQSLSHGLLNFKEAEKWDFPSTKKKNGNMGKLGTSIWNTLYHTYNLSLVP